MPTIPLYQPGQVPSVPAQQAPPALTETGRALQALGDSVTGLGIEIHKIEEDRKKQVDLIKAAEITAAFDTELARITAEEEKLPLDQRDSFRVKSLMKAETELMRQAAGQSKFTSDLIQRTFPGRKAQFLGAAFTRDAKVAHDANAAQFESELRTMTEHAIEGPDEMLTQRLTEIGGFINEGVKRGVIDADKGSKLLFETGRNIKGARYRAAMLVDPYQVFDSVKKDTSLLEADRTVLLKESLAEQERQINAWNQLQNQRDVQEKRLAEETEKNLLAGAFEQPDFVLREIEKPSVARVLGFSRVHRLREFARSLVRQGADPVQSDQKTYWDYRSRVRNATADYQLDSVLIDLGKDNRLTYEDRKDVFNKLQEQRDVIKTTTKEARKTEVKRAEDFIQRLFKTTGEFMPDPTGQGVEIMIARLHARLNEDPSLVPIDEAQNLAIKQAKLLSGSTDGYKNLIKSLEYQSPADVLDAWAHNRISSGEKDIFLTIFAMAWSLGLKHPGNLVDQQPTGGGSRRPSGDMNKFRGQ